MQFLGNPWVRDALRGMIRNRRIPQTLLFSGPEGVGKATLARRFAAELLPGPHHRIELDDLSVEANLATLADREKWPSDKRSEDPLLFSSHPDFLTFAPDGPLRQISIQQMRLLKDRAQLKPLSGPWRVFLIDRIDRANEQAANSLLKTLEEPPDHAVFVLTAVNPYDLLPTIRSRSVSFHLGPVADAQMRAFLAERGSSHPERRLALARGCPGLAVSFDLENYDKRRAAMLQLLEAAAGRAPFMDWLPLAESLAARKSEKLDYYIEVLYSLANDLLLLRAGAGGLRNPDLRGPLDTLARHVSFEWLRQAVRQIDELGELSRRNIQKSLAFDGFLLALRRASAM